MDAAGNDALRTTPLHALHCRLGAKFVAFAGYQMPVEYGQGIKHEHLHTRRAAGLFDVSHMGQISVRGDAVAAAFERVVPGDVAGLDAYRQRYSVLTNAQGGIIDDLMITRLPDSLFVVVNAAKKSVDLAHLKTVLEPSCEVEPLIERALLALQGPVAGAVLAGLCPDAAALAFMRARELEVAGIRCLVNRCGYTGEDGFELSVMADDALALAQALLAHAAVEPIGLGARDTLRLEAGLCLAGQDFDTTTTPVEADLAWVIARKYRDGVAAEFPGAAVILAQFDDGAARRRVGLKPEGRAPARGGTALLDGGGRQIGTITSGGYGPSVGGPVAMGYVETEYAVESTRLGAVVRDRSHPVRVVNLPFSPHNYHRP